MLDLDRRPGEIPGIGPIDPWLARDLARAAAQNPATTWPTDPCDHRFQVRGHDPGVKLRHLSQVRHATCTSPICWRPGWNCDFEHNTPYQAGRRTCLCYGGPKCKR